jgi:hypothetical protein
MQAAPVTDLDCRPDPTQVARVGARLTVVAGHDPLDCVTALGQPGRRVNLLGPICSLRIVVIRYLALTDPVDHPLTL